MRKFLTKFFNVVDDYMLSACLLLVFLQHLFIILEFDSISSYLYTILFVFVFAWFVIKSIGILAFKQNSNNYVSLSKKRHSLYFCLLVCAFSSLSVVVDVLIHTNHLAIDFNYYRKLFIFLECVVFMFLCFSGDFTKFPIRALKFMALFFSISIIFLFIFGKAQSWYGFQKWHMLTLNFHNPNACGMFLSVIIGILLYSFVSSRFIFGRIVYFLIIAFLAFLLIITNCRNAIVAFCVCLASVFFARLIKKISAPICLIVALVPVIFLSVYLLYFIAVSNGDYYVSTGISSITNKTDGTRFSIWVSAIQLINFNPFVGSYYLSTCIGSGNFQWHNTGIDIIVSFGFLNFVLLLIYVCYIGTTVFKNKIVKESSVAFGLFCLIFSLGIFEGFPFYSANGLALLPFVFILICYESNNSCFIGKSTTQKGRYDVVIVGDKTNDSLFNYPMYFGSYSISSCFLNEREYLPSRSFLKHSSFVTFFSTLLLIKNIIWLKPKVVEIFYKDNINFNFSLLNAFFRKKRLFIIVHYHNNLRIGTTSNKKETVIFKMDLVNDKALDNEWFKENFEFLKSYLTFKQDTVYTMDI